MNKIFIPLIFLLLCSLTLQAEDMQKKAAVNQAGYNLGESKRFVGYGLNGKPFDIVNQRTGLSEYSGKTIYGQGWFSDFNPITTDNYVVRIEGWDDSVPFAIGDHLMERISSKLAYDFFVDARGSTDPINSNESKVYSGGPTRDCGAFGLESPFEVLFYASNPALFDNWTSELGDKSTADLIELILWHGSFAYHHHKFNQVVGNRHGTLGYPGEPRMEYDYWNTLDQIAPLLAAYHSFLKPYLSEELYQKYRKVCLDNWRAYDRHKVVRFWTHSVKWVDPGFQEFNEMGNVFGQSVFSNLFMYLAERNEVDGNADQFLRWAQESAQDIIDNWDFNNPRHMWWIRNGEHITPQALAFFLMVAPQAAPEGTRKKLEQWALHIKQRTNNPWLYRSHSETEMAHQRTKELGGAPALAGSLFAVSHLTDDKYLRNLGWAQIDFVFGANPLQAHFSHKSQERIDLGGYWQGVETGWIISYPNGYGMLGLVRGTLDGTPLNLHFPEMKEITTRSGAKQEDGIGNLAYATEGWGLSNRGWMASLTFSTLGSHRVDILDMAGRPITQAKAGEEVAIELKAALNLNTDKKDEGWVDISLDGCKQRLLVVETQNNSGIFQAKYSVKKKVKKIKVSYGYLGFEKEKVIDITK